MSVLALEENGDLRTYLKESQAHLYANTNSEQTLLKLSMDVAAGMTYLSGLKVGPANWVNVCIQMNSSFCRFTTTNTYMFHMFYSLIFYIVV